MKIATWNANMAFRKKQHYFMEVFDPDVFVIQECESPEFFENCAYKPLFWTGNNKHKGLAVFSKLPVTAIDGPRCAAKHYLAFTVDKLTFIGIWAMNDKLFPENRYIGQVWNIVNHYQGLLDSNSIILGDFNWNVYWDCNPKYPLVGNFRNVIEKFSRFNIVSGYHKYFQEDFGTETNPTEFLQRKLEKSYHVDFIFLTEGQTIQDFFIGQYQDWIKYSDHMPLCVYIR